MEKDLATNSTNSNNIIDVDFSSNKLWNFSIKTKLIGSITLFMIIAFILLNLFNYKLSKDEIVQRLKDYELPTYAQNVKNEIIIRTDLGIKPLDITINDSYFRNMLVNPEGKTEQILDYLKYKSEKHNIIIGFICAQNSNYYSSTGKTREIDQEKDKWYFDFKASSKNENFNVGRSADTRKISLFNSKKIFDDNNYLGVAYIGMNIKDVEDFVLSRSFGNNSNIMMVNGKGKILIYQDSTSINIDKTKLENQNFISNCWSKYS